MDRSSINQFLIIKEKSEELWQSISVRDYYRYHTYPGTKWLPGLNDQEIRDFENAVGFTFPPVYQDYLHVMNGTDKPKEQQYTYFYSYPRDIEDTKQTLKSLYEDFGFGDLAEKGIPNVIPITGHRYLVINNFESNPVLSIYGQEAIVYAPDLISFLNDEIFHNDAVNEEENRKIFVPFWME